MEPTLPEGPPPLPAPGRPPPGAALRFYAVLVGLVVFDVLAQVSRPIPGLAWSQLFTMLFPAVVAAEGSNLRALRYLGLQRPRALPVVLGALLGLVGYFPAAALGSLWIGILPPELVERFPDVSRIFEGSLPVQVAVTAVVVGLAPLCEEAAFRGYLQRTLARAVGPWVAIVASGLLFAARHLDPLRFAPLVFLGALFGWLSWRAGSLWPAVAAHAANNAVGSAAALAGIGEAPPGDAGPGIGVAAAILFAGGALVAALVAVYWWATPAPPVPDTYAEQRDPLLPASRFLPGLVPARLRWAGLVGIAALLALWSWPG